jgi:hypothetical protein
MSEPYICTIYTVFKATDQTSPLGVHFELEDAKAQHALLTRTEAEKDYIPGCEPTFTIYRRPAVVFPETLEYAFLADIERKLPNLNDKQREVLRFRQMELARKHEALRIAQAREVALAKLTQEEKILLGLVKAQ